MEWASSPAQIDGLEQVTYTLIAQVFVFSSGRP